MTDRVDTAVVGAGPFGLSIAATLAARGVTARVFGAPMQTWREQMPPGMLLRSAWEETSLWSGDERGTIDAWARATGRAKEEPVPLASFLDYADWFRGRFVPEHDDHDVTSVARVAGGFRVESAGGALEASKVVVAVGVTPFAYAPPPFAEHLGSRVLLAGDDLDLERRRGTRVAVVGGGQAAIETAGLAAQAGAETELLVRSTLRWFADREPGKPRTPLQERLYRLAYPAVGYGPPPINRIVLHPDLFASLPAAARERLNGRLLRPGGSPWLRGLVDGQVRVTEGVRVERLSESGDGVELLLSDGTARTVDAVLLGTGYRFDLGRLGWLSPGLRAEVALDRHWPRLDRRFASTAPGLSFAGYPAEGRFGPISRFVLGTRFTAERLASTLGVRAGRAESSA